MPFDPNTAHVLGVEQVSALVAVSGAYDCALVTDLGVTEQGDGEFDLAYLELPDSNIANFRSPENTETVVATPEQLRSVALAAAALGGELWFESADIATIVAGDLAEAELRCNAHSFDEPVEGYQAAIVFP
ncbi:MAG: hypothetical protein ACR2RL_21495 [Gammaproteobacteria bacterium]